MKSKVKQPRITLKEIKQLKHTAKQDLTTTPASITLAGVIRYILLFSCYMFISPYLLFNLTSYINGSSAMRPSSWPYLIISMIVILTITIYSILIYDVLLHKQTIKQSWQDIINTNYIWISTPTSIALIKIIAILISLFVYVLISLATQSILIILIGGLLGTYTIQAYINIRYKTAIYEAIEYKKDSKYAIKDSIKAMKGYNINIYILLLTFIPWNILGIITLGISTIYSSPYKIATIIAYRKEISK